MLALAEAVGAALVEVGADLGVLVVVWLGFGGLLAALQGGGSVALGLVGQEEGVALRTLLLLLLLLVVCCVFGVEEGHFGRGVLRG